MQRSRLEIMVPCKPVIRKNIILDSILKATNS